MSPDSSTPRGDPAPVDMKRALLIAHSYPPVWGGSAVQRVLSFSRYLPANGWQPYVLTMSHRAHSDAKLDLVQEVPQDTPVRYAFALDTARHLSLRGRYPQFLAWPDRWVSWWFGAVPAGLRLVRKYRPQLIWSSYPIATTHLIGLTLHRITGLPWVADVRDPMTEEGYPAHPTTRRIYSWIERHTVRRAARSVFTTPGAMDAYADRYPDCADDRWLCLPNGYDEATFRKIEEGSVPERERAEPIRLIHSGVLYPSERDPTAFFAALREMYEAGEISPETVRVVLRLTKHDDVFLPMIESFGIGDIVSIEGGVPYDEALAEMMSADGLLILQASNCNHQIPAKLYEYLRARRPILALTDPHGDTAQTLVDAGIDTIVRLNDKDDIRKGLLRFLELVRAGTAPTASDRVVARDSRESGTRQLAEICNDVVEPKELRASVR